MLLKAIFNYAYNLNGDSLFVSVFERYKPLILFFEEFGFESSGAKTNLGELVLVKKMKRNPNEAKDWSDYVDFNRKYGPKLFLLEGTKPVVIPILPKYHKILFPDAEPNALLFSGAFVSGNAIRKAYLCYSKIKEIAPGTPALFYRSSDMQFFQCVGVIEKSIRSSDPNELARLVGIRTVYSYSEIEKMCKKEVFALLFRHARILFPPLTIDKVIQAGLLKRAPRSITRIKEGGIQ